ncbi:helix-turn-helix transcriptional regulator [Metabacillus malikii]|uniref:Transcriptional regulator with XRE-family HTH domain n=1 Tax=Metabacillus malikii TaxID=1504265 RepID=A0ABT9ZMM9_9BACI|nr:helix-turn-helix transcriptional regulator [Metabacillus malikii]MDQ0233551.1 transcriptional regulator with XRE-family HTH domain [Metabacillus malikii]
MKKQIPRHNELGIKIREARKSKGLTLGELAKGICSLGKMSNIENGHVSVTSKELEKFCEKLDIPPNFFADPNIEEKIKELDTLKLKILDYITFKNWKFVKQQLEIFQDKIYTYQIQTREIDYDFLSAIYYYETKQYILAETFTTKVISNTEENNYNLRLKIKAYNLLATIYFHQKKSAKSISFLDEALKLSKDSPTITKEERDNIYFNRAILYLYIGLSGQAIRSLNKVNHYLISPLQTEYVKLLISYTEDNEIEEMKEKLFQLREKLQQTNDKEGILRGWALTAYSDLADKPSSILMKQWKDEFFADIESISNDHQEQTLALLQLGVYVCLKNNVDQEIIKSLIDKSADLAQTVQDANLLAKNYYIMAKYEIQYKQDNNIALSYFEQALQILGEVDESLLKADILFEISTLKQVNNDAMDALKLYHSHMEGNFLFTHFHELTLPKLLY